MFRFSGPRPGLPTGRGPRAVYSKSRVSLLDGNHDGSGVGNVDAISDFHAFEVLLVLYLEAHRAPVLRLDGHRWHFRVKGSDGHCSRRLLGQRRRGFWAFAAYESRIAGRGRGGLTRLADLRDDRLVVPEGHLVADLQIVEALHFRPRENRFALRRHFHDIAVGYRLLRERVHLS